MATPVSIHARHCWRANRAVAQAPEAISGIFNPRPPLLAGESATPWREATPPARFNPRPPLLAGESEVPNGAIIIIDVSIHARHCWRANQGRTVYYHGFDSFNPRPPLLAGESSAGGESQGPSTSFNPRPPLLAGESRPGCRRFSFLIVSIHARHCWRANRSVKTEWARAPWFQSTPAIAGGRICWRTPSTPCWRRFNPRPPLLAGESHARRWKSLIVAVSIHARHCWRANQGAPCRHICAT